MAMTPRTVQINAQGYREVSLAYRRARAAALDARGVGAADGKIACPMLEASRSESAYGAMALASTDRRGLNVWSDAVGISSWGIRLIAFLSGKPLEIPGNFIFGRFDDRHVNVGFIRTIKNGVNTGVLASSRFSIDALSRFVWALRPDHDGVQMGEPFLYSEAADGLYLYDSDLPAIVDYNVANAKANRLTTFLGRQMSYFEMSRLLLGVLAQDIVTAAGETKRAILVRDVHDLYKFGWIPVHVEDRLVSAGLIAVAPAFADQHA